MSKRIGVLGCGWLGMPLAERLLSHSHEVHGTTTSIEKSKLLQNKGILPYIIRLSDKGIEGNIQDFLFNIDILIINVPPKLRGDKKESFVEKMKHLQIEIQKSRVQKVLFVSSTSVYGNIEGEVLETTSPKPVTASGKQLLESEQLFLGDETLSTTVVRFGGLIGPNRNPVTMLSGRQNLSNGDDVVNLIHLEDCILIICFIMESEHWNQIFNGVHPSHPAKREYYTSEASKLGIPPPQYAPSTSHQSGKIVLSGNLMSKGYRFSTPIAQ